MSLTIITAENQKKGTVELPTIFHEVVRKDLIHRAFVAAESNARQAFGPDDRAGKKASSTLSRRRRKYRGAYGKGISRVSRKIMSRRGSQLNWVGAGTPGMVGGFRAHPPVPEKIFSQKINTQERKKALRSAIAATVHTDMVKARGHEVPAGYPFVLGDDFESLKTTKDVRAALLSLDFGKELTRTEQTGVASGRKKMRGRGKKSPVGPLLVVSKTCPLVQSARNLAGFEVCVVRRLSVLALAPGAHPARLTLFTKDALDMITKEKLFQ